MNCLFQEQKEEYFGFILKPVLKPVGELPDDKKHSRANRWIFTVDCEQACDSDVWLEAIGSHGHSFSGWSGVVTQVISVASPCEDGSHEDGSMRLGGPGWVGSLLERSACLNYSQYIWPWRTSVQGSMLWSGPIIQLIFHINHQVGLQLWSLSTKLLWTHAQGVFLKVLTKCFDQRRKMVWKRS